MFKLSQSTALWRAARDSITGERQFMLLFPTTRALRKGKNNYAFMNTIGCIYHGYIAADLGDDILTELNKTKWD